MVKDRVCFHDIPDRRWNVFRVDDDSSHGWIVRDPQYDRRGWDVGYGMVPRRGVLDGTSNRH